MSFLGRVGSVFDLQLIIILLIRVSASLVSISIHETCHGLAAYRLGDPTAKRMGRLSLNPLHHIDPMGLLLLITAGFGWAKPVPVDPRYFKQPKQGMAVTALAGPASNFALSLLAALALSLLYHLGAGETEPGFWAMVFFAVFLMLNIGLGVFNLFPIPPLDGSKVLFSFLPDRVYGLLLYYERYVMLLLFALVFFGVLDTPLGFLVNAAAKGICALFRLPVGVLAALLEYGYL
jgi:Zn-dependent protease